jgi:hypothetical protein
MAQDGSIEPVPKTPTTAQFGLSRFRPLACLGMTEFAPASFVCTGIYLVERFEDPILHDDASHCVSRITIARESIE